MVTQKSKNKIKRRKMNFKQASNLLNGVKHLFEKETMNEALSDKSSFSETDKKALEGSISAYASGSAGIEIFGNGGKIGGEIKGTASIGTGSTETQEYSRSLSKEG